MPQFAQPLVYTDLNSIEASVLIDKVKAFCMSGKPMHPEALKAVVLKLTYVSRDLSLRQDERDSAASIGTSLANAAIKAYGAQSEFGRELINGVHMIMNNHSG